MDVNNNISIIDRKIMSLPELIRKVNAWKLLSDTVVFTNGCFDLLHRGHIEYLSKSADAGSRLIVAINADSSVKKLHKGALRPLQDERSRALLVASLFFVDAVVIFSEDTPLEVIKAVNPDIITKGGDWKPESIVGADWVIQQGGKVISVPITEGFSTTAIEEKIKNG